jgi:signal transduction histidine kinase
VPSDPAERSRNLAAALRTAASRAADATRGGLALVFATGGEALLDLRLRAASGFAVADDAREAAGVVLPHIVEVVRSDTQQGVALVPALGARGAGGMLIHLLRCEGRLHGALAVAAPSPLDPTSVRAVADLAESLALRFDYDRLSGECDALRNHEKSRVDQHEEKSEEVLKLSEALFAQDIELLRNNEKLGKIEKLKNDFIEKMSRELRTPLNSIIEAIIGVLTGENDSLSEAAKTSLRQALDDGTAFLRTLQNILDLWRIKQRELPIEIHDMNFPEMVDEAIFSVQDAIGKKPLTISQRFAQPLPKIRSDVAKLGQILFLLLDNAVRFTPSGEIEISAKLEDGQLLCSVKDTGIGICPDDQQFIFDEFYQVDDSAAQHSRGAGLGLTLVRDLITLLEGEVSVSSEVGIGTRVTFRIPVQVVG